MKNVKSLGIIALLAIIGISLTALILSCDSGGGSSGGETQPVFSVSGQFTGNGGTAKFKAETDQTVSRSARALTGTFELSGELEDGDFIFRLKGIYDADNKSYTVSAAGSFLRYTVNGTENGSTATIAVKDADGNWTTHIVSVTITEVSITEVDEEDYNDYAGGIPAALQGNWEDKWTEYQNDPQISSFEAWSYFTPWYYENYRSSLWQGNWEFTSTKYTVVEIEEVDGQSGVYDAIFAYPRYKGTDEQIKAAAEKFIREELKTTNFKFWQYDFAPWSLPSINPDDLNEDGSEKVWWYVCLDENREKYGQIIWINWDVFTNALIEKGLGSYDGDEFITEFFTDVYADIWDANTESNNYWTLRENVEKYFEEHGIGNQYYWGWHDSNFFDGMEPKDGLLECMYWEPAEDYETFWETVHYWIKWDYTVGFSGDWDRYDFGKFLTEDYLNNYLRSQNVQPETWYSRARLYMDGSEFVVQYYPGTDAIETEKSDAHHSAPPCNTKSLDSIKALTFDPNHWDWSYRYLRTRSNYRYND